MVREYRSEILERTLRTLHTAVPGIIASVIVNIDGLLVSAYPPGNDDNFTENPTSSPQVAAMAATLIGLAERTLGRLAQGDLERLLIVYPAGRAALAVLVEKDVKMGMVLYAASRARNDVIKILGS
jgi:predicted regulator of Ras-like GTPase activity (Roadblock/LC7/MglB family)